MGKPTHDPVQMTAVWLSSEAVLAELLVIARLRTDDASLATLCIAIDRIKMLAEANR